MNLRWDGVVVSDVKVTNFSEALLQVWEEDLRRRIGEKMKGLPLKNIELLVCELDTSGPELICW